MRRKSGQAGRRAMVACAGAMLWGAGGTAHAGQVTITGDVTLATTGSASVLNPGTGEAWNTTSTPIWAQGSNTLVTGLLLARSTVRSVEGGPQQAVELAWRDLRVTSTATGTVQFLVELSQLFAVDPSVSHVSFHSWSSYTEVDFAGAGQGVSLTRTRSGAPVGDVMMNAGLTGLGASSRLLDGASGSGGIGGAVGSVYGVSMSVAFVLNPKGQTLVIRDAGGPSDVTLMMVPLPTAAWTGLAGLAGVGLLGMARTRQRRVM